MKDRRTFKEVETLKKTKYCATIHKKTVMMLREIVLTQCNDRDVEALTADSTHSACNITSVGRKSANIGSH